MSIIRLEDITKVYQLGENEFQVLNGVSFQIEKGDFIAIMGQSGSGKSTLMNIIGMLDTPTKGSYFFEEEAIEKLDEDQLTFIRRKKIGFVFQQYNLLARVPTLEQVTLPLAYQGVKHKEREEMAMKALKIVGLEDKTFNKPNELSGGQQQRVSIARALVSDPEIILADEPTGALDLHTGKEVMELLQELNRQGKTIVLITHESEIAAYAKKIIKISDGNIVI
jgi:putative ABC transport system ATP-binding protein